jgi:predicted transglutaminase-like cysteine proteinase
MTSHSPYIPLGEVCLPPTAFVAFAQAYPDQVAHEAPASIERIEITPARRAVMMHINGEVNQGIRYRPPTGDPMEPWRILPTDANPPAEGTCHDIAVTKRALLLAAGWRMPQALLAEVIVTDPGHEGQHHLIVLVRTKIGDVVLDNLTPGQAPTWWIRNYRWVRVQSPHRADQWVELERPAPWFGAR